MARKKSFQNNLRELWMVWLLLLRVASLGDAKLIILEPLQLADDEFDVLQFKFAGGINCLNFSS